MRKRKSLLLSLSSADWWGTIQKLPRLLAFVWLSACSKDLKLDLVEQAGMSTPAPNSGCESCATCALDSDCARNSTEIYCNPGIHLCVACNSDRDCRAGSVCDPVILKCAKACTTNADCSKDCYVAGGYCVDCLADAECSDPAYPRCTHECVECAAHSDCLSPDSPFCYAQRQKCVQCLTTSDCPPLGTCTPNHVCRTP